MAMYVVWLFIFAWTFIYCYSENASDKSVTGSVIVKLGKSYENILNLVKRFNKTIINLEDNAEHTHKFHTGFKKILEEQFHFGLSREDGRTKLRVTSVYLDHITGEMCVTYNSRENPLVYLRTFQGFLKDKSFTNEFNNGSGTIKSRSSDTTWHIDMIDGNSYLSFQMGGAFTDFHEEALVKLQRPVYIETNLNVVKFERGASSKLTIRFSKKCRLLYLAMIVSSQDQVFQVDTFSAEDESNTGVIKLTDRGEFADRYEYTLVLNTAKKDFTGVVDIAVEPDGLNGTDLFFFSLGKYIPVIQDGQKHAFPKDFIAFYGFLREYTCYVGMEFCVIRGCVVGDNPKRLSAWKVLKGGKRIELKTMMTKHSFTLCIGSIITNVVVEDGGEYVVVGLNGVDRVLERPFSLKIENK